MINRVQQTGRSPESHQIWAVLACARFWDVSVAWIRKRHYLAAPTPTLCADVVLRHDAGKPHACRSLRFTNLLAASIRTPLQQCRQKRFAYTKPRR